MASSDRDRDRYGDREEVCGTPHSETALSPETHDAARVSPPPSSMRPLGFHRRKRPSALLALAAALGLVSAPTAQAQGPGAAGFGVGAGVGAAGHGRFDTATKSLNTSALDEGMTDGGQAAFWIFIAMFPILGLVALVVAVVMVYACPGESRRAAADAAKAEEAEGGMGITQDEADAVLEYREEDELAAVPHLGARWDAPDATGAPKAAPAGADISDGFDAVNVVAPPAFPHAAHSHAKASAGVPPPAPVPVPSPVHLADAQSRERYA